MRKSTKFKKILAIIMAVMIMVNCLPVLTLADDEIPSDATLICTETDEEHVHNEECYSYDSEDNNEENDNGLTLEEDPIELDDYLTSVTIQRRADDSEEWKDVKENVHIGDQLRIKIYYELPGYMLKSSEEELTYQIDPSIKVLEAVSGKVPGPDGNEAGDFEISKDGKISIHFYDKYVDMNKEGSKLDGFVSFHSSVAAMGGNEGDSLTFTFKDSITVKVTNPTGDINVEKSSSNVKPTEGTLDYVITVSSEKGTGAPVKLKDTLENAHITGDIKVLDKEGNDVDYDGAFPDIVLPKLNAEGEYVIEYSAELDSDKNLPQKQEIVNTVTVESENSEGEEITDTDEQKDDFFKPSISKVGHYDSTKKSSDWEILLCNNSTTRGDISGWTLSDNFGGEPLSSETDVKIAPDPSTGKDSITTHLPYVFPENSKVTDYKVTYTTSGGSDIKNQAVLTPPQGKGVDSGLVAPNILEISKKAAGVYPEGINDDGDVIARMDWTIKLDAADGAFAACCKRNLAGVDVENVLPDGAYWKFSDYPPENDQPVFITPELQIENAKQIAEDIRKAGYEGNFYIFSGTDKYFNKDTQTLIYRSEGSSDAWDDMKNNPLKEGRQRLTIIFDTDFGPGKVMNLHYSSYVNAGDGNNSILINNYASVDDGITSMVTATYQMYNPVVEKIDSRNRFGGDVTSHAMGDLLTTIGDSRYDAYTTDWTVKVNIPNMEYDGPVTVSEKLPEGTSLFRVGTDNCSTLMQISSSETVDGKYVMNFHSGYWLPLRNSKVGPTQVYGNEANAEADSEGNGYVTYGSYTLEYKVNDDYTKIDFIIPEDMANALAGKTLEFYGIKASIEDFSWDGISKAFKNNVTVTYDDNVIGTASQTQKVKRTVISKEAGELKDGNTVPYCIKLNQLGVDLVPGADTLTVTDELSFTPPAGKVMNANLTNVVIREKTDDDKWEDITDNCKFTVKGSSKDGKRVYTAVFEVPDSAAVEISYDYKFSGSGKVSDLTNTASVEGSGNERDSQEQKIAVQIQDADSGVVAVGINVEKVERGNYTVRLSGAKFTLKKWTGECWMTVLNPDNSEEEFITDEKHGSFNTGELEYNTAYRLIETEAPEGYEMRTAEVYDFYIPDFNNNDGNIVNRPPAAEKYEINPLNDGDSLYIENDKIEKTSVSVTKVWNDNNDQDRVRPDSVKFNVMNGNKKAGEITLSSGTDKIWQTEELTGTLENLPKYENGKEISYIIEEADVDSNYTASGSALNGGTITNTHEAAETKVSVEKKWDDDNDYDKLRPESVTIHLYADGKDTGKTLILTEDNNWKGSFEKLDLNKDGKKIEYTVTEDEVGKYTSDISGDADTGFVVTNKHTAYYPSPDPDDDPEDVPEDDPEDDPVKPDNPHGRKSDNPDSRHMGGHTDIDNEDTINGNDMGNHSFEDVEASPDGVKTGDSTDMIIYLGFFLVSLILLCGCVAYAKRHNKK